MSEANELLENLSDAEFAEYSEIEPVNDILLIDALARTINVPGTELLFGVETDKNVERKYFKCPRIVGDNIDLSKKSLRVHFKNANNETDRYVIEDIAIDGDYITFSWLVSEKVLAHQGTIYFTIVAVSANADGSLKKEWNTTLASGKVLEGLEVELDEYEEEEARDVLLQLLSMLETEAGTYVGKVRDAGVAQVSSIQAEGTAQFDAIAKKGGLVLASIPDEYSELNSEVKQDTIDIYELKRKKANAVTTDMSGESIYVTDAAEQPPVELSIFGKSKQEKSNGYQLFDASKLVGKTENGTTVTNNGDGSFTVSGGETLNETYDFMIMHNYTHEETIELIKKAGVYRLINDCTTIPYMYVAFANSSGAFAELNNRNGKTISTTITDEHITDESFFIRIGFYGFRGDTIVAGTTKPMFYCTDDSDGTWEPFTGCKPGPNPEYPLDIVNVENSAIKRFGKNLFKVTEMTGAGVTLSARDDYYVLNGTAEYSYNFITYIGYLPVGNYTLSANNPVHNDVYLSICDIYSGKIKQSLSATDDRSYATSTANITKEADDWLCRIRVEKGKTYTNYIIKPQLEFGSVATDYEKTDEQTVELSYALKGVPISAQGNYTDSNGQMWYSDEIDLVRGVYIPNIMELTFDGSSDEKWYLGSKASGADGNRFELSVSANILIKNNLGLYAFGGYCNRFMFEATGAQPSVNSFRIGTNNNLTIGYLQFNPDTSIVELDSLDAWKTYLASNPITVYFPVTNPEEIVLSVSEIATYRQLFMEYPITNLYNNKGAWMKGKYANDSELYLRGLFDSIVDGSEVEW